jgi:hypothetical protein
MGQTLSEPVVEKVRVCVWYLIYAADVVFELPFRVYLSPPWDFILCSILFGVSLSLAHAEPNLFATMLVLHGLLLS